MLENYFDVSMQRWDNYEGKKENVLVFNCQNCNIAQKGFLSNYDCVYCFFNGLCLNSNKKFEKIYLKTINVVVDYDATKLITSYLKKYPKTVKKYTKLYSFKDTCHDKEFTCKIFSNSDLDFSTFFEMDNNIKNKIFMDPIRSNQLLKKKLDFLKSASVSDNKCDKCLNKIRQIIIEITKELEDHPLYIEYQKFQKKKDLRQGDIDFYEILFTRSHKIHKTYNKKKTTIKEDYPIANYKIGDPYIFNVRIYKIADKSQMYYTISLLFNKSSDKEYFEKIVESTIKKVQLFRFDDDIVPLENLIDLYQKEAIRLLELSFNITQDEKYRISFYTALKILNLNKWFPFLMDDYIEEVYLDSPDNTIYIDHQKYGRCLTDVLLTKKDIERIKTFLRLYSQQRLDYTNPSIQHVIKNKFFYCRFSVDTAPVNFNEFSLDIRKLDKNILTIQDLLKFKTLNPEIAAFLYFCVIRRINITVTGETNTGKTTLINALDLLAPQEFRKIYVENVIESLNQFEFDNHQVKYKVDSLDDTGISRHSKSNQIKILLHRTPDLIYLGEILTKEEAEAMFRCLAAGLRGFQTIHSNDIDSLINRFIRHFKIDPSCLNDLNLVLLMKKEFNKRRIATISEIHIYNFQTSNYHGEIIEYSPEDKDWVKTLELYEVNAIQKIRKYEALNIHKFEEIIDLYKEIFQYLLDNEKIENTSLTALFHRISFLSMVSFKDLKQFWEKWKNKQHLILIHELKR